MMGETLFVGQKLVPRGGVLWARERGLRSRPASESIVWRVRESIEWSGRMNTVAKRVMWVACVVLVVVVLAASGVLLYLYSQGGKGNYVPPQVDQKPLVEQALASLKDVSDAVESYYTINLSYPASLDVLVPDFLKSVPKNPSTNKPFSYRTSGGGYTVEVPDATALGLKALKFENGRVVRQ